jgi:drug/metabolite transporter (DMT)-like permease
MLGNSASSSSRLTDWALLLVCNLIWASQFVLAKLVQERMGPVFATFVPMTIATALLVPIVARERRVRGGAARPRGRDVTRFLVIGIAGQVAAQLLVTWGVGIAPASNAALLSLTLPVATAVIAFMILGERMTPVRWVSFALALIGIAQCSGVDWQTLDFGDRRYLLGNLLVMGGVCGSAFYNVYSKRLLETYTPLEVLLYSYYAVVITLLPLAMLLEPASFSSILHAGAKAWLGLLLLAVFQYGISMVIFLAVLTRLDATQAGLSNYLIPFFGLVIAWLVLGERLTASMVAGGVLVLVSTLLVTVYEEYFAGHRVGRVSGSKGLRVEDVRRPEL